LLDRFPSLEEKLIVIVFIYSSSIDQLMAKRRFFAILFPSFWKIHPQGICPEDEPP
jgi:hypothetical protein